MSELEHISDDDGKRSDEKFPGAPGTVVAVTDPAAPSTEVSSKRQSLSDVFTIVRLEG